MSTVAWKPKEMPTITPAMPGGRKLIEFAAKVVGPKVERLYEGPGGGVAHAEIRIGESLVMTGDPMGTHEPLPPSAILVYVPDVDAAHARALEAGAKPKEPLKDQFYGDRTATVHDPFGNRWTLSTHIEDVSEEEMMRRMEALMKSG